MTLGAAILGCLTLFLLASLVIVCVNCIKIEKNILEITAIVERRVLELYDVKK
jgi:hypothetical protein